MPLNIIRNDITKIKVDTIVNATNIALTYGGGVCGATFSTAGGKLQAECNRIGRCDVEQAVITGGYNPAKHNIHTIGPTWQNGLKMKKRIFIPAMQIV